MPRNPDEIGALWLKQGPKAKYMSGTINGVRVVVFKNDKGDNEKAPDYRVLKAKPREGGPVEDDETAHSRPREIEPRW